MNFINVNIGLACIISADPMKFHYDWHIVQDWDGLKISEKPPGSLHK